MAKYACTAEVFVGTVYVEAEPEAEAYQIKENDMWNYIDYTVEVLEQVSDETPVTPT